MDGNCKGENYASSSSNEKFLGRVPWKKIALFPIIMFDFESSIDRRIQWSTKMYFLAYPTIWSIQGTYHHISSAYFPFALLFLPYIKLNFIQDFSSTMHEHVEVENWAHDYWFRNSTEQAREPPRRRSHNHWSHGKIKISTGTPRLIPSRIHV